MASEVTCIGRTATNSSRLEHGVALHWLNRQRVLCTYTSVSVVVIHNGMLWVLTGCVNLLCACALVVAPSQLQARRSEEGLRALDTRLRCPGCGQQDRHHLSRRPHQLLLCWSAWCLSQLRYGRRCLVGGACCLLEPECSWARTCFRCHACSFLLYGTCGRCLADACCSM